MCDQKDFEILIIPAILGMAVALTWVVGRVRAIFKWVDRTDEVNATVHEMKCDIRNSRNNLQSARDGLHAALTTVAKDVYELKMRLDAFTAIDPTKKEEIKNG